MIVVISIQVVQIVFNKDFRSCSYTKKKLFFADLPSFLTIMFGSYYCLSIIFFYYLREKKSKTICITNFDFGADPHFSV